MSEAYDVINKIKHIQMCECSGEKYEKKKFKLVCVVMWCE